jgi:acetyl/propionyl-CoA carboxylase alpha subunit
VTRLRHDDAVHEVLLAPGKPAQVDGEPVPGALEAVGPATFVWRDAARGEVFHCVRVGDQIHLAWQGRVYRLSEEREGATRATRHATGALEAPMPGKVIKVSVTVGQAVKKGQELLVIEAMKMENALRAPKDGHVKSLAARVGDMVSPGLVLVEVEG